MVRVMYACICEGRKDAFLTIPKWLDRSKQAEKKAHACNSPAAKNGKSQKEKKWTKGIYATLATRSGKTKQKKSNSEREGGELGVVIGK